MAKKRTSSKVGKASQTLSPPVITALASTLLLVIAFGTATMMAAKHIWALTLPGCGQGGGCDWATKGPWSSLAGWPIAYLGCAFFGSLLLLWLLTFRRGVWTPILYLSRVGVLISLFFTTLMLAKSHLCAWCLATHIANFCWWASVEFQARRTHRVPLKSRHLVLVGGLCFLLVSLSAAMLERRETSQAQDENQRLAQESLAKLRQSVGSDSATTLETAAAAKTSTENVPALAKASPKRFGGRFWTGAKDPAVRIVIFQDYQCTLCKEVEDTLRRLINSRSDVALSVKQWPFDKECNPNILSESPHPGACFAAKCAEAAGSIGGADVFWKFHYWLVERGGEVTRNDAISFAQKVGIDSDAFTVALTAPNTDSIITADISEGIRYGITFTPQVFVNGYEIRGWQSPGTLPAAVELAAQAARQKPREKDQPDPAIERQFQEWLARPVNSMVIQPNEHFRGPLAAPTAIVMYADISDAYTAAAYRILEPLIRDSSRVCFIFRVFPLQADCNDMVQRPINPHACEAAHALEATYLAKGPHGYWDAFQWLAEHQSGLPQSLTKELPAAIGVKAENFTSLFARPEIETTILANIASARQLNVNTSPTIYVNGKHVPDWRTPGLLKKIIQYTDKRS